MSLEAFAIFKGVDMILSNLYKRYFKKTLKEEYEFILKNEYGLDEDTIKEYQNDIDLPTTDSITLIEAYAFSKLGEGGKSLVSNVMWRNQLQKILSSVPNQAVVEKYEVYIGQVPDLRFNAAIYTVAKDRFLILINSGLMLFLFRIARIFIATCRFKDEQKGVFEPELTLGEARQLIQANVAGIVVGNHNLPQKLRQPVMIRTSNYLTEFLELFIIAHELGHLFYTLSKKEVSEKGEEFFADMMGYIQYKGLLNSYSPEISKEILHPLFYSTPHFLFYIFASMEREGTLKGIKISDTHPAASTRSLALAAIQRAYNDFEVEKINKHIHHFTNIF